MSKKNISEKGIKELIDVKDRLLLGSHSITQEQLIECARAIDKALKDEIKVDDDTVTDYHQVRITTTLNYMTQVCQDMIDIQSIHSGKRDDNQSSQLLKERIRINGGMENYLKKAIEAGTMTLKFIGAETSELKTDRKHDQQVDLHSSHQMEKTA